MSRKNSASKIYPQISCDYTTQPLPREHSPFSVGLSYKCPLPVPPFTVPSLRGRTVALSGSRAVGRAKRCGAIFPAHQQLAGCMSSHHSCSHLGNCQQEDLSSRLRAAPACQSTRLTTSWQWRLLQSGALTLSQETAHTGCCRQSPRCPQGDGTGPCALGLCP